MYSNLISSDLIFHELHELALKVVPIFHIVTIFELGTMRQVPAESLSCSGPGVFVTAHPAEGRQPGPGLLVDQPPGDCCLLSSLFFILGVFREGAV